MVSRLRERVAIHKYRHFGRNSFPPITRMEDIADYPDTVHRILKKQCPCTDQLAVFFPNYCISKLNPIGFRSVFQLLLDIGPAIFFCIGPPRLIAADGFECSVPMDSRPIPFFKFP